MKDSLELYKKFHSSRNMERKGLFNSLKKKYSISSVLYPGSSIHITPSFFFKRVVYVDNYKQAPNFFKNPEVVEFINKQKIYNETHIVIYHDADYTTDFGENNESFDMLLSQYAGFISQACKKYLKIGGLLVVNDSHGDASMAYLDKDYELIGIYERLSDDNYSISEKNLTSYFIPKKRKVTKRIVIQMNKGPSYTFSPSGYIFKRVS